MSRTLRKLATIISLAAVAVTAPACGDDAPPQRELAITDPMIANPTFCAGNDQDPVTDGLQYSVEVSAAGFRDGAIVLLVIDGIRDPQLGQPVLAERVTFSNVTLGDASGVHSVQAQSEDGAVVSNLVQARLDLDAPALSFVNPQDGSTLESPGSSLDYDVEIFADVEDGQMVELRVVPPSGGAPISQGLRAVSGMRATFPFTFNEEGQWMLEVVGTTSCGNEGGTTIEVTVDFDVPPPPCTVEIMPTPISVTGVGSVLNAALDPVPEDPDFQAAVRVTTDPGNSVELFVNLNSAGAKPATTGLATYDLVLVQGAQQLRASCTDGEGNVGMSVANNVLVDTIAPTCAIGPPMDGATITPADDLDTGDGDIDIDVVVAVTGAAGDTEGENVVVTVGGADQPPFPVTGGSATIPVAFTAPSTSVPIVATSQDHALNPCTASIAVTVETAGCTIAITSPTGVVSVDADLGTSGVQVPVVIAVDPACTGQTITLSSCDVSGPVSATATGAPPGATFNVTFCAADLCISSKSCRASVSTPGGIVTEGVRTVTVDNVPPAVSRFITSPSGTACSSTITPAADRNPGLAGTQIQMQLIAPDTVSRWFEISPDTCPPGGCVADPMGFAELTLTPGLNTIVAKARDAYDLVGTSAPCSLTLADLLFAITDPLPGQTLGLADGTPSGGNLAVQVCGDVEWPPLGGETITVTVTSSIDSKSVVASGATWCVADLVLASGASTISGSAVSSPSMNSGMASVDVTVDVTPPSPPTGFAATPTLRNEVQLDWSAPDDDGAAVVACTVKVATTAITEATWATLPTYDEVPGVPPGSPMGAVVSPLKLGPSRTWYFGVKCHDGAANGSALVIDGPIVLDFTAGDQLDPEAIPGGNPAKAWYGSAMTGVDLDDDGYSDLAVGSPGIDLNGDPNGDGVVYVYMGGPSGLAATPAYVIRGTDPGGRGRFGSTVAMLDWNDDGIHDLAVGAPYAAGFSGVVHVYLGGLSWTPGASTTYLDDTISDVTITPDATDPLLASFALFGRRLAPVDFDGDGRDDLLIGATGAASFKGAAVLLFGGSSASSITVPGGLGAAGTKAFGFTFATTSGTPQYGFSLAALGRLGDGAGTDTRGDVIIAPVASAVSGGDPIASEERAFVYYGRAQPMSTWVTIPSTAAEEMLVAEPEADDDAWFGEQLGSLADQNGDGNREIVISSQRHGSAVGRSYVLTGGTSSLGVQQTRNVGTVAFMTISGAAGSNIAGAAVANTATRCDPALTTACSSSPGDVDGDGIQDLIVASRVDPADGRPHLYVFYGGSLSGNVTTAAADATYSAPAGFVHVTGAAWVGDTNGDGLDDLAWADSMVFTGTASQPGAAEILW